MDKNKIQAPPRYITLQELVDHYSPASEIAKDLDYAMLCLVLQLRYEPQRAETIIGSYETLRELRDLIQTYSPIKP